MVEKSYGDHDVDFFRGSRRVILRGPGGPYGLCDVELRGSREARAHIEV